MHRYIFLRLTLLTLVLLLTMGHVEAQKLQLPLNQSWDKYCPKCTLANQALCKLYPCAKYNLRYDPIYRNITTKSNKWVRLANKIALKAVKQGDGPFGAVLVQYDDKTGKAIRFWTGDDHVERSHDPTAHAEMTVIRKASIQLGVDNLGKIHKKQSKLSQPSNTSHCVLYSSTEPCAMCIAAMYWAGINKLVFAATRYDANVPGVNFSDKLIDDELKLPYQLRKHMQIREAITDNSLDAYNYYKRSGTIKKYGNINNAD